MVTVQVGVLACMCKDCLLWTACGCTCMVSVGVRLDCGLGKQFLEVSNEELYQVFQAFQSPIQSSEDVYSSHAVCHTTPNTPVCSPFLHII